MRLSLAGLWMLCACQQDLRTGFAPERVYGVPNLDDDDVDGQPDWDQAGVPDDNERFSLPLDVPAGRVHLDLKGQDVRVWLDDEILVDAEDTEASFEVRGPVELQVEFGELNTGADLQVVARDTEGHVVGRTKVLLNSAPLILNHHLQLAEEVYAVVAPGYNDDMVDGFVEVLGDRFADPPAKDYRYDVWVQDELEFGTATAPGMRLDVVIDSIRSQGDKYLDKYPEANLAGTDTSIRTWGLGQNATSQDSFGNLEVTPPITVDGVHYPFGRIYYGLWNGKGPTTTLTDMLAAQGVQDPIELDTTFLCVGHVDEFLSFVPDPTSDKGFRLLVADVPLGRAFLEGLDPAYEIAKYKRAHGYETVGELLADEALWDYNDEVQRDGIDPNVETLMREAGLTEADIIRIPALFQANDQCGGYGLALIPGTANLVVAQPDPDGPVHLFLPDPFFRDEALDTSADPFIAAVEPLLPAGLELHWLDDWALYHELWGEVHCGTNTRRTPTDTATLAED